MSLGESEGARSAGGLELKWIGDGAWCAVDGSFPEGDARRLIAYVECRRADVEVVWVHRAARPGRFATLREAWHALEDDVARRRSVEPDIAPPELAPTDLRDAEPAVA
ncbi:hypothetical protein [Microbacterium immunditiarum]|uniref:Uncharacterized protein n=1 Tax=Microbacterium immunditiarum TaxID=337480 RepID=A0A7Y9GMB5_9MICO|nr:hypothetical protein [Microbacterium immunditiarum]NYE19128.1 hypothetical protein [Microbacterium immunditiarum]